ncbi:hypothetical protein [Burkholderia pyrrocinia]|uniref:hypothetical protein n=1 Tax=Burkholderia pyrrocinia TaxID=60550 RepID=UPI0015891D72|nr:hypothetical protein [Burkholderia pyrrocinia]
MERKLMDYPVYAPLVKYIYDEMRQGHFDDLVSQGLAAPSSASEYRTTLENCLGDEVMGSIPDEALMDGYVFEIGGHKSDRLSIEVPVFAEDGRSDAFAVFRVKKDESAQPTVYLYDILVP